MFFFLIDASTSEENNDFCSRSTRSGNCDDPFLAINLPEDGINSDQARARYEAEGYEDPRDSKVHRREELISLGDTLASSTASILWSENELRDSPVKARECGFGFVRELHVDIVSGSEDKELCPSSSKTCHIL